MLIYFPLNVAKLKVGWRLYLSCSRLQKAERHLIIKPQTQRAPSKFCSRLFDQHVVVWERTDNLPVSQPARQPLAVSQSVSLPLQCSKLPKTGGKQRVRQKKSNLTFCSCIQSSHLVLDGTKGRQLPLISFKMVADKDGYSTLYLPLWADQAAKSH